MRYRHIVPFVIAGTFALTPVTASAIELNLFGHAMDDQIRVSGYVVGIEGDDLTVETEVGTVVVELNDLEDEAEALLVPGDLVTIDGWTDTDPFETHSVEAETVHVARLNAYLTDDDGLG